MGRNKLVTAMKKNVEYPKRVSLHPRQFGSCEEEINDTNKQAALTPDKQIKTQNHVGGGG